MAKKSFAILLILLLTLSNAAFAALGPKQQKPSTSGPKTISEQGLNYDAKDKVRVIVELDGESGIEYANKKQTRYKDLAGSTKSKLQSKALEAQDTIKNQMNKASVGAKYFNSFTTVINGFSAEVEYGKIKLIEKLSDVQDVHIVNEYKRPVEQPEMIYSKELVQAQEAWRDYGFKGQGMVVGVIDTGIDPSHRDMVLSDDTEVKLTESDVKASVSENDLPGKFYTEKVPYGYNYMDQNSEIRDLGAGASMHGMHVSGTVGANGDEENGGIKGVAPEAQLLALKVFGNDPEMPSTWSDIYVKAIDDAILLGADVLNMSLGSTASFVLPDDPEQKAVSRAVENGVLMSISAGNSAHFGNGYYNPMASNPDIGVAGSPGISSESLQVASLENSTINVEGMKVYFDGELHGTVGYQKQDTPNFLDLFKDEKKEVVYVGTGEDQYYEGKDVAGKIVFVVRTGGFFYAKIEEAAIRHGAAGVIVRGAESHGDYVNMALDAKTLPMVSLSVSAGNELEAQVKEGKKMEVVFDGSKVAAVNPAADTMSTFTSWGVTPNLDFKPEITAPGGKIYSTLNDDQYGMMSGTSMAAPHVAGGAALVLQRVDEEFNLSGADRVNMAKNIMMNTSVPVMDKSLVNNALGWSNPYSPRRQGAGVMQLHSALATPVVVTESESGIAKVALKEVDNNVNFTVDVENFSDEAVTYDVSANVQTDFANEGFLGYAANVLEAQEIQDTKVTITSNDKQIEKLEIPANSTVKVNVAIDLSEAKVYGDDIESLVDINSVFKNGYFVEGYLTLSSEGEHAASIPYVGFNGDWSKAPILDAPLTDVENTFYGLTGLAANLPEGLDFLGFDQFAGEKGEYSQDLVAFSPNGDGVADTTMPILSFLRNAKKVEYNVLDKDGNKLRTLRTENHVRKNYYDGTPNTEYTIKSASSWDGKVKSDAVAEGDYFYEVRAIIDYPGAEWQSFKFPVKVDVTAPTFNVEYDKASNALSFSDVNDKGVGVAYLDVKVNGESKEALAGDSTAYSLTTAAKDIDFVDVVAVDYAGNMTTIRVPGLGDSTIPDIHWMTPEALGVVDTLEPVVTGYVTDKTGIKELMIGGKKVEVKWNEEKQRYEFETKLTFDSDGVKMVDVSVVDGNNNKIEFQRRFFVDSTAPTLEISDVPSSVGSSTDSVDVTVKVKDNFDEIRLYQDGSEVFYNELVEPYVMEGYEKSVDLKLKLVEGENKFTFKATDLAGHEVTKEISILSGDESIVNNSVIEEAIKNADSKVEVELTQGSESKVTAVMNKQAVKALADTNKATVLKTKAGNIEIPSQVMNDLSKDAKDGVKVSVNQVDSNGVPKEDSQMLKSNVYDFTISLLDGSEETKVSSFTEPVTVELSVKGKTFDDKRKVAAFYLNEESNKWEYVGGKVVGDNFVFQTDHFSTYAVMESDKTFKDIQKHWAQDEIEVLASRMITSGKTEDTFAPQQKLTRAEFAVLLSRSLNLPMTSYEGVFKDVKESKAWAYAGIEAAYRAGIVKGSLDGSYNPDAEINRQEMATMIVRAVKYKDASLVKGLESDNKFKDDSSISAFAKESVYQANELGIIKGRADHSFDPKADTTRAETAVMLYRMLNVLDEM
ncbi:S8 family serine peptidase [Rossellomorea sp. YZS02]|uniref:S8 family serine peptidase n=1 Tax=Rossellomorea sp. YZS02 TaxID=3097358 RepID=UPI002A107D16|nr:S8 family serine peptidase [Rossellomorea sp. YZS02]MDX8344126.1 S8 family serine peptidase [Rossellomorea sp. YZS02]